MKVGQLVGKLAGKMVPTMVEPRAASSETMLVGRKVVMLVAHSVGQKAAWKVHPKAAHLVGM